MPDNSWYKKLLDKGKGVEEKWGKEACNNVIGITEVSGVQSAKDNGTHRSCIM